MRPKGQLFDLKSLRKDYNLNQKDIAETVGISTSFLSAIEHGRRSAPASLLQSLESIYNVSNIADYIKDRPREVYDTEDLDELFDRDNKFIQYKSPRAMMFISSHGETFTKDEVLAILDMQNLDEKEMVISGPQSGKNGNPRLKMTVNSLTEDLLQLLKDATARANRAEKKAEDAEKLVCNLRNQIRELKRCKSED